MTQQQACLAADEIHRFLEGQFSVAQDDTVIQHLDSCPKCRAALEDSVGGPLWLGHVKEFLSDVDPSGFDDLSRQDLLPQCEPFSIAERLTFLAPTDDPRMLGRMGIYEVSGVIGFGAMGVVLKAFESSLNRYVALKVLWPHLAINGVSRQRFAREAKAAAAVVHEHVVPIYAVDEFQGLPYIVLRYVPGRSLHDRIARQGQLQVDEVLRIGRQIAAALDAAHAQGLVHRDVKPANILLENGIERVQVTDFGLARAADDASLTHSGTVAGTPQFMAPEQARGDHIDHRGDLFSLGSVLYTMCAGHPPFRAETMVGVLTRICNDRPRPLREINPAIPEWLVALIGKLMAKDRNRRFQTAAEVSQILEQELAHLQNPTSIGRPNRHWARRRWTLMPAAVGTLVMVAGMACFGPRWWVPHRTDAPNLNSSTDESQGVAAELDVWHGNMANVAFSQLSADADRLEWDLVGLQPVRRDFGHDEWKQLHNRLKQLEADVGQDVPRLQEIEVNADPN